ncbi:MAG: acyl carrier protein [Calditrichia bacterium]
MSVIDEIEKFLLTEVAAGLNKESISPDEDLLMQGIIDSLGIMKLTAFLEKTYGIKVADEDMVPENFQSLNSLNKFVELKK